jgi:ubiquinone/menaquinone biosynthesis C-methylase UbiE
MLTPALERLHQRHVIRRRRDCLIRSVSRALAPWRPARVLDVGCGNGEITLGIAAACGGPVAMEGVDVLVRPDTQIPVVKYDGTRLPFPDASFDAVMAIDVLHHADSPAALLREMTRVARRGVVLKDHNRDGLCAQRTLELMDDIGNRRHGVRLVYHYLSRAEWSAAFAENHLSITSYDSVAALYPWPVSWVFGRSLHFVAALEKTP